MNDCWLRRGQEIIPLSAKLGANADKRLLEYERGRRSLSSLGKRLTVYNAPWSTNRIPCRIRLRYL